MLNGLSSHELINKGLQQSNELEKAKLSLKNPYANIDKNLLVDSSDISNNAIELYKRDLDIKKFTALAMSDMDNMDCTELVLRNVFGAQDEDFDNKIIESMFDNKRLLRDLLG